MDWTPIDRWTPDEVDAHVQSEAADQRPAFPNAITSRDRPHGSMRNSAVEQRTPGIHRPDRVRNLVSSPDKGRSRDAA
jgi:hypothetical protein